jgi:6-phosphogluconate dehydrogenase
MPAWWFATPRAWPCWIRRAESTITVWIWKRVATIWRGGCIIRARLLEAIREAYAAEPHLPNLLLNSRLGGAVEAKTGDLREVVCMAARSGIPAPGLMAALSYFDTYRSERLPANLVMAQRDYFGAHRYERIDKEGAYHTAWTEREVEKL